VIEESTITGGAGGGGGCSAGYNYRYDYYDTKGNVFSTYKYYATYSTSTGGGGGGGGVLIVATGTVSLSGTIDVKGGDGGDRFASSYTYCMYAGAGGGGGGGNVYLGAKNGFDISGNIDASGGRGGWSYYKYTSATTVSYGDCIYSRGGEGGRGAVTLVAGAGKEPVLVNAGNADLGDYGTIDTGTFGLTKDGVSKWVDSGVTAPDFTSVTIPGTAIARVYIEVAQIDPDSGQPDLATRTGWVEATGLSSVHGRRWFRFWVELQGSSTTGSAPTVERVIVSWTSKK
jgi:hypothetical protein